VTKYGRHRVVAIFCTNALRKRVNMKNRLIAAVAAVLVVAAGASAYVANRPVDTAQKTTSAQSTTASKIKYSQAGKQAVYDGVAGQTALQTLQALTKVNTKDSSYGTMVVGINGKQAEDGKTYWAFYVNGTYANEGAGTYQSKKGDKITWKLEDIKL